MRHTVTYLSEAQNELADIWNRARNKQAVSTAANRIDRELKNDPEEKADWLYGDWLYVEPPLAVVFRIIEEDRKVEITQVWFKE